MPGPPQYASSSHQHHQHHASHSHTPEDQDLDDTDRKPRKRSKNNVSRACTFCRRKRTRCDGRPRCSTCQLHGEECIYDRERDGRRPAAKVYVEALEQRVRQLERELERVGGGSADPNGDGSGGRGEVSEGEESAREPGRRRPAAGAIRITGTGSIAYYGPTSAFMHLPDGSSRPDEHPDPALAARHVRGWEVDWETFDWQKDLAPNAIRDPRVHRSLLSGFFSYLNDWCGWVDEAGFLSDLITSGTLPAEAPAPRTAHYSPFLHNVLVAIALINVPSVVPDADERARAAAALAGYARDMIEGEAMRPMTTTVRGMMLLGSFHLHSGNGNLGFLYAMMGGRMAQVLGLNIDCSDLVARKVILMTTKFHRDQTFWTVFSQDALWAFNMGRSPTIDYEDFETALPPINEAEDALPWYDHHERQRVPHRPSKVGRPAWKSSTLHWSAKLMILANEIHRAMYRVRQSSQGSSLRLIPKLELDLSSWLLDLPGPLRLEAWEGHVIPPHILCMHATFHYLRILLHRPACFEFSAIDDEARRLSVKACDTAAQQIMRAISLYPCLPHATMTLPSVIFTAGTTLLLSATRNDASPPAVASALASVDECIANLGVISWPTTAVGRDILRRMRDEWHPPAAAAASSSSSQQHQQATATPEPKVERAIEQLRDPNSDMVRLLTGLGWVPPGGGGTSAAEMPQHQQQHHQQQIQQNHHQPLGTLQSYAGMGVVPDMYRAGAGMGETLVGAQDTMGISAAGYQPGWGDGVLDTLMDPMVNWSTSFPDFGVMLDSMNRAGQ